MKRYFVLFCAVLTMILLPTSCLKGDDNNEVQTYNDMAVAYFNLGTLNRTLGTETTKLEASGYKFHIDQLQRRIYNPDSLPVGTDITKVPCSMGAYNNGGLYWEDLEEEDALIPYSSADSLDFTSPRKLRVYAYGTAKYSTYIVQVNVHQEDGDEFLWTNMVAADAFKRMSDLRVLSLDDLLIVAGQQDGTTVFFSSEDGKSWQQQIPDVEMALAADAYANTLCFGGYVYMLTDGNILRSMDLQHWEVVYNGNDNGNGNEKFTRLLAAGTTELYCTRSDHQIMMSEDGGKTWQEDYMESSLDLLPTEHVATVCYPYSSVKQIDYILLAGCRDVDVYPQDKGACVWHKIVDYSSASIPTGWNYMEWAENNTTKVLPRMGGLSLIHYTNKVLAIGKTGESVLSVYESKDSGLTWTPSTSYTLPSEIDQHADVSVCVDNDNFIWVVQTLTGQVWRGRLNQLGWDTSK